MFLYQGTRIPGVMGPPTWETHIPGDVCSPTSETHIPSDICSSTQEHVFLEICVPLQIITVTLFL